MMSITSESHDSERKRATAQQTSTWQLFGPTLVVIRPCCGGTARLKTVNDVPREEYALSPCSRCGTKWTVTRTTIQVTAPRMDRLEWETSDVRLHAINRVKLLRAQETT